MLRNGANHGLVVNPAKSEMVLFTRRYKVDGFKPINFYKQELVRTGQVKYLGIILDSKLKWKAHVDAKCIKPIVAFSQLRSTGKTWGYSLDLYNGNKTNVNLCRSGVVASDKLLHCWYALQLEHVQQLACLYITGAMRTSPTIALEMITG